MNWYTERSPRAAPRDPGRWLPTALGADEPRPEQPPILFGEPELARIAAAAAHRARQAADADLAAQSAARQAAALETLAAALAEDRRAQRRDTVAALRRTIDLATALARAGLPRDGQAPALLERFADLLAEVPGPVRLRVPPALAESLRPLLPEIAARAGLAEPPELEPDPLLPEGAATVHWPGGWLEQDPDALAASVAALLAAQVGAAPEPTIPGGDPHDAEPV